VTEHGESTVGTAEGHVVAVDSVGRHLLRDSIVQVPSAPQKSVGLQIGLGESPSSQNSSGIEQRVPATGQRPTEVSRLGSPSAAPSSPMALESAPVRSSLNAPRSVRPPQAEGAIAASQT